VSRKINIRLRRTIVISLVLFSILLTSGELFLYKSSISRDNEHVSLVTVVRDAESAILETWILTQLYFTGEGNIRVEDLTRQMDRLKESLTKIDDHLHDHRTALIKRELAYFHELFGTILDNYEELSQLTPEKAGDLEEVRSEFFSGLEVLRESFHEFNSMVPDHISEDTKLYRTEILLVTILNALIIVLAGYAILRLTSNLERAERSLIIGTVEVENRERERIAADLHDGLGALLSGMIIHLQVLKKENVANKDLTKKLEHVNSIASDALSGLEETIYNLNPPILTRFGLHGSLERLIKRINATGKTEFMLRSHISNRKFSQGTELLVFRICSELINNTLKHANATTAILEIDASRKGLKLSYSDNGEGFVYNLDEIKERKSGINNIIQRVESMNGQWSLNTSVGLGLQVYITLPLSRL
jgi:signal transduction histidine kinase